METGSGAYIELLEKAERGFSEIPIDDTYKKSALTFLKTWLSDPQFADYVSDIAHLIEEGHFDYLLDSFYQVIPFGTGGRRGEVGVGPNRINPWTIKASAQGHAQYLIKHYGDDAKSRGIVCVYDIREFQGNDKLPDRKESPVWRVTSKDLAYAAASVYMASDIKVYMFDGVRTTPELSFAVRHLNAVAGDVFSASHNPPNFNGKKVYDEFGGQLIPPDDEALVEEVTRSVSEISEMAIEEGRTRGLLVMCDEAIDNAYIQAATSVSLSDARDVSIVYTPLHGCGMTSVYKALAHLGFTVHVDPNTSNESGKFENVTFNIPNPEVPQSFETTLRYAHKQNTDLILNSDPDADRLGVMVRHDGKFVFVNGNEIAAILTHYVLSKRGARGEAERPTNAKDIVIKTDVTTNLVTRICEAFDAEIIPDLLVGFKYIGAEMNRLETERKINSFALGCEESHGYIAGNYARDKDAITASIWLAELAAELKQKDETLIDYLHTLSETYGYYKNYLTEIRMLGATGRDNIVKIQQRLRSNPPSMFGRFKVQSFDDYTDRTPIVSETDRSGKNVLVFHMEPFDGVAHARVTVRPSGTEPKIKMYFELGTKPLGGRVEREMAERSVARALSELEQAFMNTCYEIIDVEFPERGFLLFSQIPLEDKLHYFEIEEDIADLKQLSNKEERREKTADILSFLGSNPTQKCNDAFKARFGSTIETYLNI